MQPQLKTASATSYIYESYRRGDANQLHASTKKNADHLDEASHVQHHSSRPRSRQRKSIEAAFDRINKIVDYAFQRGVDTTLEAEDHRWTNFHLESYLALYKAGYKNLGTVIQSRLFRTEKDIARFEEACVRAW